MAVEYLNIQLPASPAAIQTRLTELGAEDWELIEIIRKPTGNFGYFKKDGVVYEYALTVGNDVSTYGFKSALGTFGTLVPTLFEGATLVWLFSNPSTGFTQLTSSTLGQIGTITSIDISIEGLGDYTLTWNASGYYEITSIVIGTYLQGQDGNTIGINLIETP